MEKSQCLGIMTQQTSVQRGRAQNSGSDSLAAPTLDPKKGFKSWCQQKHYLPGYFQITPG